MESESTLVVLKTSLKPKLARASKPIPLANWNPKPNNAPGSQAWRYFLRSLIGELVFGAFVKKPVASLLDEFSARTNIPVCNPAWKKNSGLIFMMKGTLIPRYEDCLKFPIGPC